MSFNAIRENRILAKIFEFTVFSSRHKLPLARVAKMHLLLVVVFVDGTLEHSENRNRAF